MRTGCSVLLPHYLYPGGVMGNKAMSAARKKHIRETLRTSRELLSEIRKEFARDGKKRIPLSELVKRKAKG